MVNTDDFIKRLEIILEYYSLNASSFADKIGVQRSSMSHLLSGRNKPSLDFILKIIEVFQEVDLYWLLNGKGVFPKDLENEKAHTLISNSLVPNSNDLFSQILEPKEKKLVEENTKLTEEYSDVKNSEKIEKIVLFYKNGTFKIYNPD